MVVNAFDTDGFRSVCRSKPPSPLSAAIVGARLIAVAAMIGRERNSPRTAEQMNRTGARHAGEAQHDQANHASRTQLPDRPVRSPADPVREPSRANRPAGNIANDGRGKRSDERHNTAAKCAETHARGNRQQFERDQQRARPAQRRPSRSIEMTARPQSNRAYVKTSTRRRSRRRGQQGQNPDAKRTAPARCVDCRDQGLDRGAERCGLVGIGGSPKHR